MYYFPSKPFLFQDHSDEIVLNLIAERKKTSDLGKSFKDERYEEQKFRLGKCGLSRIVYLIGRLF